MCRAHPVRGSSRLRLHTNDDGRVGIAVLVGVGVGDGVGVGVDVGVVVGQLPFRAEK